MYTAEVIFDDYENMANNTSIIDEILSRVDIVDVIGKHVPLKRAGANFSGCCPFHNEKTPSFMVSPQKQIFKCFGCGKGGNIFSFVQEYERVDFWDAVKTLAEQNHIDISQYQQSSTYQQYSQDEKEKMKRIHKLAQEFFVEQLKKNEQALQYLKEERKLSNQIIEEFGIGYAPDKHYELLQFLRSKGFSDEDLLQASLAKRSANSPEVYSFFRNRITFPIYDLMKNVVGFTARAINPDDQPKYLNSAEHKGFEKSKILYGLSHAKNHIATFGKLIVVEGQMDVIALTRLGVPVGVATSWTALSEQHVKLLKRYTEHIYFLFDNDQAGLQATFRALKMCYNQDVFPKIINLGSESKDADDLANREDGKQLFTTALEETKDGFSAIFETLRASFDMSSPVDKQKLINAMFELIISVANITIQEHYKLLLAEKLWFAPEIINIQFKKYTSGEGKIFIRQLERIETEEKTESYHPSREILFACLFYQDFLQKLFPGSVENDKVAEFLQALTQFSLQISVVSPESYLAKVLKGTLSEQEIEEMNEFQLWREKELGEADDVLVKKAIIQRVIAPSIQEYFKMGSKSSHLSNEEKMELNKLRISIGKK